MVAERWQRKRSPLSTAENMIPSTSPRLKTWRTCFAVARFTGGLVAGFFWPSTVSEVDTFIEKPSYGSSCTVLVACAASKEGRIAK